MKNLIVNFALIFACLCAQAANVTLAWDPSPDKSAAGYLIFQGGATRNYTNQTSVGLVTNVTLIGLTVGSTYFFAAKVFTTNGLVSDFSTEAAYTIPLSPPVIVSGPVGSTNQTGATVTFTVTATGANLSYAWLKNGSTISGATNATLTLTSVTWANNGVYSVSVSNTAGTVSSSSAQLAVIPLAPTGLKVGP